MTCLLNTLSEPYPALESRINEAGLAVSEACAVTLPSSWDLAAALVLDDLVEKGRLSDWAALEANADRRIVTFDCRPPFLPRSCLASVAVSVSKENAP